VTVVAVGQVTGTKRRLKALQERGASQVVRDWHTLGEEVLHDLDRTIRQHKTDT